MSHYKKWLVSLNCETDFVKIKEHWLQIESKYRMLPPQLNKVSSSNAIICNPLSKNSDNPWLKIEKDRNMEKEIYLDVSRTFQEIQIFNSEKTLNLLTRVIFVYCKKHESPYKQGMNEIIGGVYLDLVKDERIICDEELTHGILYEIFRGILSISEIQEMFFGDSSMRCGNMFDCVLPKYDKELHAFLVKKSTVPPTVFLLKWLRLLFLRDFEITEIFEIWDFIFAQPQMIDIIAVAMIIHQKPNLLLSTDPFTILMNYPKTSAQKILTLVTDFQNPLFNHENETAVPNKPVIQEVWLASTKEVVETVIKDLVATGLDQLQNSIEKLKLVIEKL
jgi:Rab-GTPase-TBC domain